MQIHTLEFVRDSGSVAYAAFTDCAKYFLRITKPAFYDTVSSSLDIHMFLQRKGISVPSIIFTRKEAPCVCANNANGKCLYILYEYIDGNEVDPEQDTEAISALIGPFHNLIKSYPGTILPWYTSKPGQAFLY